MTTGLFTSPDEPQTLHTSIRLPYTLTPGIATGTFLAAHASKQLIGTRCKECSSVTVPPADVCISCGGESIDLIPVAQVGQVTNWTVTPDGCVVLVRLDGTDTDILQKYLGDHSSLHVGARVRVEWTDGSDSNGAQLAGFVAQDGISPDQAPESLPAPISVVPYEMELPYAHAYGPYYGRMFDELGSYRRLMGSRCSQCQQVLLPARAICDACYRPTDRFVEVADTGRLQAFSIINLEFVGQTREPPYVYAEIVLDGSATRLIHTVGGIDIADAANVLSIGMPVRAVWRQGDPKGTIDDIEYFEPIGPQ